MYKKENGSLLHLKAAGKVLFFLPPLRYYGISFLSLELAEKCAILVVCRYGSSVERQLPKLERRVRLPLSAYFYALVCLCWIYSSFPCKYKGFRFSM